MAQTIEDVESRTVLQQFHSLYKKQTETDKNVKNLDTKIDKETTDRQSADLTINSQIQELKNQIESLGVLFTYKGEVATIDDLPKTDNKLGDVYYVDNVQSGYIWLEKNGTFQWEEFGPAIDLSQYAKQEDLSQVQSELTATDTQVKNNTTQITNLTNSKQDKLTAGTNITIENNTISATVGNQRYEHFVRVEFSNEKMNCCFRIINFSATPMTLYTKFSGWLIEKGFNTNNSTFSISTVVYFDTTENRLYVFDRFGWVDGSGTLIGKYINMTDGSETATTLSSSVTYTTDTVVAL